MPVFGLLFGKSSETGTKKSTDLVVSAFQLGPYLGKWQDIDEGEWLCLVFNDFDVCSEGSGYFGDLPDADLVVAVFYGG